MQVFEQYRGTGSSNRQTTSPARHELRLISNCMEDAARNRSHAHDQQGTSEMAGKGQCDRTGKVHSQAVRRCYLTDNQTHLFCTLANFATEPANSELVAVMARRSSRA